MTEAILDRDALRGSANNPFVPEGAREVRAEELEVGMKIMSVTGSFSEVLKVRKYKLNVYFELSGGWEETMRRAQVVTVR